MSIKKQLKNAFYQTWLEMAQKNNWPEDLIQKKEITIDHPDNLNYGDYSSNLILTLYSKLKKDKKAQKTSKTLTKNIKLPQLCSQFSDVFNYQSPSWIAKTNLKNNFVNISIKKSFLIKELEKVVQQKEDYGRSSSYRNKIVVVEFAQPNTHKKFHIGHLRGTVTGESLARILDFSGAETIRANYQGDVGMHIAKCLYSILQYAGFSIQDSGLETLDQKIEFLGKNYVRGNKAFETDKKAKKEILEINKKIYSREDKRINSLWKRTREWSLDYFEQIYKRVYTHFDRYYFESGMAEAGKQIVLKNLDKGIFKRSKGAVIFPGSKYGLHDRVFITQEGNPTYEAKDLQLAKVKLKEYSPDLMINLVGGEQKGYFQVLFKVLAEVFPETEGRYKHIVNGLVALKRGKMSSREGNVVEGEWLLDKAKEMISEKFPDTDQKSAEKIAVGAVKYSFLKVAPGSKINFDFQESINLEGNSGSYLQYSYARAQSILRKSPKKADSLSGFNCSVNHEEAVLLRTIYRFPEVVEQAVQEYNPSLICSFLYDLARIFNTFYNKHRILGIKDKKKADFRLLLTTSTAQVIKNGLYLLAIKSPEEM